MKSAILIPDNFVAMYRESSSNNIKKAYISFINEKNKVNKESKLGRYSETKETLKNEPVSGFSLFREETTYVNEYTEGRTYVSLFDPRGFIVKITVDNYIKICLSTDVNKGEIKGSFVYAFIHGYPKLINTDSEEYKKSLNRQDKMLPVNADSIVAGQRYCLKRDAKKIENPDKYIYLGKYDYHEILNHIDHVFASKKYYMTDNYKGKKHIFMLDSINKDNEYVFEAFMPSSLLTSDNSDYIDENLDHYINKYLMTNNHNGLKIKYLNENIETKKVNKRIEENAFIGFIDEKVYVIYGKVYISYKNGSYNDEDFINISCSIFNKKDFDDTFLISKILNRYVNPQKNEKYCTLYKQYEKEHNIFESCMNHKFFIDLMKLQELQYRYEELKYCFYEENKYHITDSRLHKLYQLLTDNNFKPFIYE